jgi:hypothetical protein
MQGAWVASVDHDQLTAVAVDHNPATTAVDALEHQPSGAGGAAEAMIVRHMPEGTPEGGYPPGYAERRSGRGGWRSSS